MRDRLLLARSLCESSRDIACVRLCIVIADSHSNKNHKYWVAGQNVTQEMEGK